MLGPEPFDRHHCTFPAMSDSHPSDCPGPGKATRLAAGNNQEQPQEDA
ncbi:MAG: hypothetical protein PVG51_02370 [Desulfosarcina sp.]